MIKRIYPISLLSIACLLACIEPRVVQNYPDYQPQHRIAMIRKSGFEIAVSESQKWGDSLQLTPGKYLLEFREKFTGIKGAAICKVEPGGIYEIEITRKRYMEMSGRYVYEARCERVNKPGEPDQYEFPEEEEEEEKPEKRPAETDSTDYYQEPAIDRNDSEVRPLAPAEEDVTSDDPVLKGDDEFIEEPSDSPKNSEDPPPGKDADESNDTETQA
ncbi:MAG: hypothetical protein RH862_12215 [Leptospiraceae bacterium]